MGTPDLLTATKLTIKINLFEIATGILLVLAAGVAALIVRSQLEAVGASQDCLLRWVASIPTSEDCTARVQDWASLNEGSAGKVMGAMQFVPWIVGLLAGVPLVGRELESGTAAVAWALSGSRSRWLTRHSLPVLVLVMLVVSAAALPAALLADTRSAGGAWSSVFADADLFGIPVVARALAATAIGLVCGAVIGRVLPALIIAIFVSAAVVIAIGTAQPLVVHATYDQTSVGGPGSVAKFLASNPDFDVRFVTPDDKLLTLDAALGTVPAGTLDSAGWLQDHYRLLALGVRSAKATEWQLAESVVLLVLSAGLFVMAQIVVGRRAPH